MGAPVLYLFDRFDERLGILPTLGAVVHTEELGGEDTIEFDCLAAPEKGARLLWRDPDEGVWREHVVVRTDEPLGGPAHVYAEWALSELLRDFVEEAQLVQRTATQALSAVLAKTRWGLETVGVGDARRGTLIYHMNALAALRRIEEVWGGELECSIVVAGGRVAKRTLSLPARRGSWRGLRFTYGKNMAGCTRTVLEDEVFTALYGFGKGLAVLDEGGEATGGFTRRLTFGEVNGGVNWVGDDAAREAWGRWDAARSAKVHAFGQVTFPDCEDANQLLALTEGALADAAVPKVSYEIDAALLPGVSVPGLGDDVAVIDESREPAWHLTARVVARQRELCGDGSRCTVTLGTVQRSAARAVAEVTASVATVAETASVTNDAVKAMEEVDLSEVTF